MKKIISIKGMHCRSCEVLLESELSKIPGVKKIFASSKKATVTIYSDVDISLSTISEAVQSAGYEVGLSDLPVVKLSYQDLLYIVLSFLLIALIVLVATLLGASKILDLSAAGPSTSLAVIFTIGVTAGLSSCMALVGGLVLGASARYAEKHPNATTAEKFRPHIFFNLGRIASFFILGGLIGSIGSFLKLSSTFTGYFMVLVGIFMFLLGIQLLEIFPKISNRLTLPKGLSKIFGLSKAKSAEYSHKNSVILGALTFFLPCGFTQAMQIYAISTGNFVAGAMVMGVFALGTTPGLLGVGGLTSLLKKGKFANFFYKFVGVLVIILSIYNLSNGLTLSGLKSSLKNRLESTQDTKDAPITSTEVQVAKATYDNQNLVLPRSFTFKVNQPVRLEILAKDDGEGCMGSIMIPSLVNQPQFFVKGEKVLLEFIPKKTGMYDLACAMGIPAGEISIIK